MVQQSLNPDGPALVAAAESDLNPQQRNAVAHGNAPVLIIAGAGTGKTKTLASRVARQIANGVDPNSILLLTFTRRAAQEMLRRVAGNLRRIARELPGTAAAQHHASVTEKVWGGTFHAIATHLLRRYGTRIGLEPHFTIHDRADSEDLMNLVRTELGLDASNTLFPKKSPCMDIYSSCINTRRSVMEVVQHEFPWCQRHVADLKRLFAAYCDRKAAQSVLDFDDLLLYWRELLLAPDAGEAVRRQFAYVFVDEYQDTNALQAEIIKLLRPDGAGVSVVGDDAQSIYAFRGATVRNNLDFPQQFPGASVITLEQNYRSTQPILDAANAVIAQARERYTKNLWTDRRGGQRPVLVTCCDDDAQADFVIRKILEHREEGIDLCKQAVLFRASHHSLALELELARQGIPFRKYGGMKFVETAHVKDLVAFLRVAENPADVVAGLRVLTLLPGIGPKTAHQIMATLAEQGGHFRECATIHPPKAASVLWPELVDLMTLLAGPEPPDLSTQIRLVRTFYAPLLEQRFSNADDRLRDLEQLEQLAARFQGRSPFLAEIALDPPERTQVLGGNLQTEDDDCLVLSTVHSAKGLEWDAVYVIHAADGSIPSNKAFGNQVQLEEELRLFYVALTRAKAWLYVLYAVRQFVCRGNDRTQHAQLTRFVTPKVRTRFDCDRATAEPTGDDLPAAEPGSAARRVCQRIRNTWE
jgi:DNA helicase-2/ATP-dependent DNA helicase PcrA